MVSLIGWTIFLGMFWYLAQKGIKIFESYLKKRAGSQADDELFRYMLDRHWEPWARTKGIGVRKKIQKIAFKFNKKSQDSSAEKDLF